MQSVSVRNPGSTPGDRDADCSSQTRNASLTDQRVWPCRSKYKISRGVQTRKDVTTLPSCSVRIRDVVPYSTRLFNQPITIERVRSWLVWPAAAAFWAFTKIRRYGSYRRPLSPHETVKKNELPSVGGSWSGAVGVDDGQSWCFIAESQTNHHGIIISTLSTRR